MFCATLHCETSRNSGMRMGADFCPVHKTILGYLLMRSRTHCLWVVSILSPGVCKWKLQDYLAGMLGDGFPC